MKFKVPSRLGDRINLTARRTAGRVPWLSDRAALVWVTRRRARECSGAREACPAEWPYPPRAGR
jgi:hypothetical protein